MIEAWNRIAFGLPSAMDAPRKKDRDNLASAVRGSFDCVAEARHILMPRKIR